MVRVGDGLAHRRGWHRLHLVKTVLAIAYGGGHMACLLPVIEQLLRSGEVRVEVVALTTAAAMCAQRGIAYRGFCDFPGLNDARTHAHGQRLVALNPPHPHVSAAESIAYLGASYRDLEDTYGADAAAERFAREGRQAFLPVASLAHIIADVHPDAVLVTSAPRAEWAAVIAARAANIPAVVVVDLFGLSERERLLDPAYGDVICVLTDAVRQSLVAEGRPAEQVYVTGNPVFDSLAEPALRVRGLHMRQQRGWDASRVITWASQPEPTDPQLPRRIEAALMAALTAHPDWHLVLRPHPSDVYVLPSAGPQLTFSTRADHLHTLLAASDVVVTMTSTVGLEAVLLGVPLVTWDASENTPYCPYARMGIAHGVTDLVGLEPAIVQALAGQGPHPQLPPVGAATRLITAQVLKILR